MSIFSHQITKHYHPNLVADDISLRKTNTIIGILVILSSIMLMAFFLNAFSIINTAYPFLLTIVLIITKIGLFIKQGSFFVFGNLIAFTFFCLTAPWTLISGGIYADEYIWMMGLFLFAFIFADLKSGICWLIFTLLWGLILCLMEIPIERNPESINPTDYSANAIFLFLFMAGSILYFRKGNDFIIEKLKEKRAVLKDQKLQIIQQKNSLEQAQARLIDQNRELEQFAYIVSHDLKEPLRTVKGFSNLLKKYIDSKDWKNEEIDHHFGSIEQGTLDMEELITNLLEYARFKDKSEYEWYSSDLMDLVKYSIQGLNNKNTLSDIEINYSGLPTINVIPQKMTLLFSKLINYAIDAKKEEEILRINIDAEKQEKYWDIKLVHNGELIPEDELSQVFLPFNKSGRFGVQLATCKKIVELHEGEIWMTSEEGKGTIIGFRLKAE